MKRNTLIRVNRPETDERRARRRCHQADRCESASCRRWDASTCGFTM